MRSTVRSNITILNYLLAEKMSGKTFAKKGAHKGKCLKQGRLSAAIALSLLVGGTATVRAQPMEDLGVLKDGDSSIALSVSADGTVIVGNGNTAGGQSHAFRYDLAGGMTDLSNLGDFNSTANGVSANGAVIVGSRQISSGGQILAFRYENGIMTSLGALKPSGFSVATGVSADGTVIVGYSMSTVSRIHAFRYSDSLMKDLGTLSGMNTSLANGVSADGTVIVGVSSSSSTSAELAFRYDTTHLMTSLGTLSGTSNSVATAVSGDGAVIVGYSYNTTDKHRAFRYDTAHGMTALITLGGINSEANAVSANGKVIVGSSYIADNTANHAFKIVGDKITDLGTLGGTNSIAYGVSADGSVIVGSSDTGNNETHAFIYNNVMVDVPFTYAALGTNASQLAGLFNARRAALGLALHDECNSVGVRPVCVSVGGRSSRVQGGFADTAAQLQLGFRLGSQLRIGATVDQGISTSTPGNYVVNHSQPLVALYAAYAPSGTPAGLQLKVSMAQGSDDVGITRSLLANTEAGQGKSKLKSKGGQLEAAYGWELDEGWYGSAFAGVKRTQLSRAAYTETSGADFPVSYQAVQQTSTTAYLGLQEAGDLADDLWLNMRIGVELDLRSHQDDYTGTMKFLGPFSVAAPTAQRTRGFASISGAYRITPTQQISVGAHYSQQPQRGTNGMAVILRYSAAL